SPCRKASSCTRASGDSSEPVTIKPIRGIFADGWAYTGSGKVAAAPPSNVMNSRRFMGFSEGEGLREVSIAGQGRASQQKRPAHVRFGSGADIARLLAMSAFSLKADKAQTCRHVRFVP